MGEWSDKLKQAIKQGAEAAANDAVAFVVEKMEYGYDEPHVTYIHNDHGKVNTGDTHTAIADTGLLQQSIDYAIKNNGDNTVIEVGTPIEYAPYVHEGTYKLHGRPFLKDDISENIDSITAVLAKQNQTQATQ